MKLNMVDRSTASSRATEVIRQAILAGDLPAGQPIRQEEFAARLGISRVPLREALRQLESEGFVTSAPHRGVVVASFSVDELREISEIRATLESEILRLAIPRHTPETIRRAQELIDAIDTDENVEEHWGQANWRFHEALYAPADRPRMLALIQNYHAHTERYLRMHISVLKYLKQGQREHRQLLKYVRQRDVESAANLIHGHVMVVADMIESFLKQQNRKEVG